MGIFSVISHFPIELQVNLALRPGVLFTYLFHDPGVSIYILHYRLELMKQFQYAGIYLFRLLRYFFLIIAVDLGLHSLDQGYPKKQ